jgi:ribosomal-protein-alanine N-acetyltransferase
VERKLFYRRILADTSRDRLQEYINYLALKLFIFVQSEPTTIIGNINFRNIIRGAAQFCSVGYSLAETEQSKGYMT